MDRSPCGKRATSRRDAAARTVNTMTNVIPLSIGSEMSALLQDRVARSAPPAGTRDEEVRTRARHAAEDEGRDRCGHERGDHAAQHAGEQGEQRRRGLGTVRPARRRATIASTRSTSTPSPRNRNIGSAAGSALMHARRTARVCGADAAVERQHAPHGEGAEDRDREACGHREPRRRRLRARPEQPGTSDEPGDEPDHGRDDRERPRDTATRTACRQAGRSRRYSRGARWPHRRSGRRGRRPGSSRSSRGRSAASTRSRRSGRARC